MRLLIFVFKQEGSEKRFIFFSVYPLTSFLTGLAKCVKARKALCRQIMLKYDNYFKL